MRFNKFLERVLTFQGIESVNCVPVKASELLNKKIK